jgi:hypothetical protein
MVYIMIFRLNHQIFFDDRLTHIILLYSGQDLGDAVWAVLSAVAHNATSITVFNGMIEASSCLDPKGLIRMDLSGKRPLGPAGAQQLGRALADSAMPSVLTALDLRLCSEQSSVSKIGPMIFYLY